MKIILFFSLIGLSLNLVAVEKVVGVKYYKNLFGHIHQNTSTYSTSLTTIACGHPVKLLAGETLVNDWVKVRVGDLTGYIEEKSILDNKPKCFQDKYPKFFQLFNLNVSELYYWGRLYDQYLQGHTKAR